MIYINTVIIVHYVTLAIISRKHFSKYKDGKGLLGIVRGHVLSMGECAWNWISRVLPVEGIEASLEKLLRRGKVISPKRLKQEREVFLAQCVGMALTVFFVCNLVELVGQARVVFLAKHYEWDGEIIIERESYQGEYKEEEIFYEMSGQEGQVVLQVSPIRLKEEEFLMEADKAAVELEEEYFNGDKVISESMELPVSYREGAFSLSWESENPELISSRGGINEQLEGEPREACMRLTISYFDFSATYSFNLLVGPRELSREEEISGKLSQVLVSLEQATVGERQLVIPSDLEGMRLRVKEPKEEKGIYLLFGVVIGCLIPMIGVSRLKEKEKKRNTVLTKEYPYFVDSLWLYIQSGMTIKRALGQYVDRATPKNSEDYLIKELQYTLNQIATGQSEYEAYDELGSRLGLPVYGSLMRHISQNLKMGTKDLKGLMETEVSMALDSRRETAKSLGEQASTKLIFPMIVLLMVVMIIIIAPAMMGL